MFNTQKRAIRTASKEDDELPVVSVFLAPNEPLGDDVIGESLRPASGARRRNRVRGRLLVVVENKVADASDAQARELNITGSGVGDFH